MLELLLNLPIVLLVFLSVLEFGQLFANLQIVALAGRAGAEKAAQIALPDSGSIPQAVLDAVEHQLESSKITRTKVILEHNANGSPRTLTDGSGTGAVPSSPKPTLRKYARVTVFVPMTEVAPNVLNTFGINAASWIVRDSTTYRYELTPAGE